MRTQCCRENIDVVAKRCGLNEITVNRIKEVANFCKEEAAKGNEQICHLTTEAVKPLMAEKDPEIKQKAIVSVSKLIESKKDPETGRYTKRIRIGKRKIKKIIRGIKKEKKQESLKEDPPKPDGKYDVLLADPPWRYKFAESSSREIENQYPTLSIEDIKTLKIPAADNSILFLWSPPPKLEEAISVLNAWGFTYRTCAVWDKEKIGMGYWFRQQHELILVGVKGDFHAPEEENRFSSVIRSPRTNHSEKPAILYEMIEKMFPDMGKVELFARNTRKGWVSWGNEI